MPKLRLSIILPVALLAGLSIQPASAQYAYTGSSPQYPQATQLQCKDSTAFWSLWRAILDNAPPPAPATSASSPPLSAVPSDAVGNVSVTFVQGDGDAPEPPALPVFPVTEILASLQAMSASQYGTDPASLDPGEQYYFAPAQNFQNAGSWAQTAIYAQAASDYEQQNFSQAIKEFDAIVSGQTPAPTYRAAAAYSAARATLRLGNLADGVQRVAAILADQSLSEFWPETWNLIDRTRTGGDIAPLAAAELLQESRLMVTPSRTLCDDSPYNALGAVAVYGMSPAAGMPFQIFDAAAVQPGIDYAVAHDAVVAAALQMYKSAATDRQNWHATHNPLWALSLGADGGVQDITTLNEAISEVGQQGSWPNLSDRARATFVWLLTLDEVRFYAQSGDQTKALGVLKIPGTDIRQAFQIQPDPNGEPNLYVNQPPDVVSQAIDATVNGVTQTFLIQALAAAQTVNMYDISQQPGWLAARKWAIASSQALHHGVAETLKPALVYNIDELYLNPALHLQTDPVTGEIKLGALRWILDDWSSAQLIALSRQPYVAEQDRQAMVGAAWIRAYALGHWSDVFAWLPDVRASFPTLTPEVDLINQAWLPSTKQHLALYLALHAPGFVARPSFSRGTGGLLTFDWVDNEVHTQDFLGFDTWNPSDANWWCPALPFHPYPGESASDAQLGYHFWDETAYQARLDKRFPFYWHMGSYYPGLSQFDEPTSIQLSPLGHMGDGGAELAAVQATGSSTERFADDAVNWATNDNWPDRVLGGDTYLPETLHLAVRATRYACRRPPDNTPWSRAAYTTLHERFPDSVWAAETPYWYGDMTKQ